MNVVVSREAARDIQEAVAFFELRRPGLGADFRSEVFKTFELLSEFPRIGRMHNDLYKWPITRFAYSIIYRLRNEAVQVWTQSVPSRASDRGVSDIRLTHIAARFCCVHTG